MLHVYILKYKALMQDVGQHQFWQIWLYFGQNLIPWYFLILWFHIIPSILSCVM